MGIAEGGRARNRRMPARPGAEALPSKPVHGCFRSSCRIRRRRADLRVGARRPGRRAALGETAQPRNSGRGSSGSWSTTAQIAPALCFWLES